MSRNTITSGAGAQRTFAWPLELEVELCAGRCEPTAEQLRSLTALLNDVEGVRMAAAEPHARANLVTVRLTVDADDPYDAHDRACALVRDRVGRAGLGPAVLVATRSAATARTAARRMG